jgi:hypothetical protein
VCCLQSYELLYAIIFLCLESCYVMICRSIILCVLSCITGTIQVTEGRILVNPASDKQSGLGVYGVLSHVTRKPESCVQISLMVRLYIYLDVFLFVLTDLHPKKYRRMSPKKIHISRKRDVLGCTTLCSHLDIKVVV